MKILIIGNGFDIAHGLQTKYTDFLEYTECCLRHIKYMDSSNTRGSEFYSSLRDNGLAFEFSELAEKNVWLKFFYFKRKGGQLKGDTWIDFEQEIGAVISMLEKVFLNVDDSFYRSSDSNMLDMFVDQCSGYVTYTNNIGERHSFFLDEFKKWCSSKQGQGFIKTNNRLVECLSEFLFLQLKNVIRAFEIYCVCFVNEQVKALSKKWGIDSVSIEIGAIKKMISHLENEISFKRRDLYNNKERVEMYCEKSQPSHFYPLDFVEKEKEKGQILEQELDGLNEELENSQKKLNELQNKYSSALFKEQDIACVLTFNYTNTFKILYGNNETNYCHIHGEAQLNPDYTNMILGIDDTLQKDKEDIHFRFAKFKKYFQRIINRTGSEYKDWTKHMKSPNARYDVYILGHSLGSTDHDILREFLDAEDGDRIRITIFSHDEVSEVKAVEKIIEMIGKDNLIRRVHGSDWSIRFVNQYDNDAGIMNRLRL